MATPQAVAIQTVTESYISAFNIHKPVILDKIFRKYGNQGLGMYWTMNQLGNVVPVAQTYYDHFEENHIIETLQARSTVADPGAGNPINITLAAANLDTGNRFYARVNDNVMFPNNVVGVVRSIDVSTPSAPVLTIYPASATANIGAVGAGSTFIVFSNSFAEATGQPKGRISKPDKLTFNTQIMKEAFEVSGSEMTNQLWYTSDTQGNNRDGMLMIGTFEADMRMAAAIDGAFLFGQPIDNPTLVADGQRATPGLVPWVIGGGNVSTYSPGLFNMSTFDAMSRRLDRNFAPNAFIGWLGFDLDTEIENTMGNLFTENPLLFAGAEMGSKEQAVVFGFKSLYKAGRTFNFKRMPLFSNSQLFGATGFSTSGTGIFTPMDEVKDPVSRQNIASMRIRYKEMNGYSRRMEIWNLGSAGAGPKTNDLDVRTLEFRGELGTEFFGSNRFYALLSA